MKIEKLNHKPFFYRLYIADELVAFKKLLENQLSINIFDTIHDQLSEWVKCKHPEKKLNFEEIENIILQTLNEVEEYYFGVWVYYPWNNNLVHLLPKEQFIELRTNRNRPHISREEVAILATKKVGIIGLSVGQSIALSIAMERICGSMVLADFDSLELSNLNRIRTGVHNLGMPKTVIAAREIAEIDPFIEVEIMNMGIDEHTIDSFCKLDSKIDIMIEVCDSLPVKIMAREKAKQYGIPVLMDTNDRGMLDVERFDLDAELPVFRGLLSSFEENGKVIINDENKTAILSTIIDYENISEKMKYAFSQIGKTISSWPQLASAVLLGGAITTHLCREILLEKHQKSARYYVDLDLIFAQ